MEEDLKEYINKYGDTLLTFKRYYKYAFTYSGIAKDGTIIEYTYGGCGEDIYRYEVTCEPKTLNWHSPESVERYGDELCFR